MEGVDEKVREANVIIYDHVQQKYICPLCKQGSKSRTLKATHHTEKRHIERLQVFNNVFRILDKQPFCKLCNRKLDWQEVQNHAGFHKIIPYWDPPDKHQRFFANYLSRVTSLYYCHLCDRVLYNWFTAWTHLDEEGHSGLLKKVEKHELEGKWDVHCNEWLVNQLTPGPKNQIECRMCKVTMDPSAAESHTKLPGHTLNKYAHHEHFLERVKKEELDKSSKPPQEPKSNEQINPKSFSRPMICNFSIEPDFVMANTILKSEQVDSSDESESENHMRPDSPVTKVESSLDLENSHVDDLKSVDFEFLVTDSSWVLETSHPLFIELTYKTRHKKLNVAELTKPFYCLLCFKNLATAETAKKHTTRKTHARSLKKYGSDYVTTKKAKYYCQCCDEEKKKLVDFYRHIIDSRHVELVDVLIDDFDQTKNNKSSEIITSDNVNLETCSKNLDLLSSSSSLVCSEAQSFVEESLSSENLTRSWETPKSPCDNSRDLNEPKDQLYENSSTSNPEFAVNPKVCETDNQEGGNLENFRKDFNWIIKISNPLYKQGVPKNLRKKLTENTEELYCLICSDYFSGIEVAKKHVSDQQHTFSMKKYGCDCIVINESGDYQCTCCNKKKREFDQIYNHILSDGHANQLSERNQQNNGQTVLLPEEKKSSDIKTIDNGVVRQPLCEDLNKHSISSLSLCKKPILSDDNSRDNIEPKDRLPLDLSAVKPESSLKINDSRAARRKRRDLEILDRDLNWIIRVSNPSYKQIVPKNVRKQWTDDTEEESLYCLICLKHYSSVRPAKKHKSDEEHAISMKKYGCDCIVMNETGGYRCTCCARQKENFYQIYNHLKSDGHIEQYHKYSQQNGDQSMVVQSKNTSSERISNDNDISQPINIDLEQNSTELSSSFDNVSPSDKKVTSSCEKLTFCEQPKPLSENLLDTSKPNDQSSSSLSTIIAGSSLESKKCNADIKKRENSEYFEEDSNWIIGKSHPLFHRLASRSICKKFAAEGKEISFYCIVCVDAFSCIDTATEHESSEHHIDSMKKHGCDRIVKAQSDEYCCTCCFQQKMSFDQICNHLMSYGHIGRVCIFNQQKDSELVPIRGENGSSEMITNDYSDSHSFCQDLEPSFLPNLPPSCQPNLGDIVEDSLSSNVSTIDDKPSSKSKFSNEGKCKKENFKDMKKDLNWIIETSNPLYEKIVPTNVRELLTNNTDGELLYCLICLEYFFGKQIAKQHISDQCHVSRMKKYGCELIVMSESGNYHCTCCDKQIKTLEHVYHHPLTNGHAKRFRNYNQRNSSQSTSVNAQNELKLIKTNDGGIPLSKEAIEQFSRSSSTSCDKSMPLSDDSTSSYEKMTSFDDKSFERSSVSKPLHENEKKEQNCQFLESDLNWVISISNPVYKRVVPNNRRWASSDYSRDQLFCCLVCVDHLFGIETAKIHISHADHENSMKKYGCNGIVKTMAGDYYCTHCNRQKEGLEQIYNHLISEAHIKQLNVKNLKNGGQSVVVEKINKSSNIETIETGDSQNFSKDHESLCTNSLSSRDNSCDNSTLNFGIRNKRRKMNSGLSTNSLDKETHENFEFRDSDLNWMIGVTHPLFKLDKTIIARLIAKKSKKSYCLICCSYYSRIESAKKHIASEKHKDCLKLCGCHYIELTPKSEYLCTCCNTKEKNFNRIYSHVISEGHMKKVCGIKEIECKIVGKNEPNVKKSNGSSSVKVPTVQDSFNLKDSSAIKSISKNRKFRETDLNWVVSGTHQLCKKLYISRDKKMDTNTAKESFFCLICWSIYGEFFNFDEAEMHISSEIHARSIKKYGCDYIELTPKFRYHCTCCDRQKGSFTKIFSHITSDGHRKKLRGLEQEKNIKPIVANAENESSEVIINNSIVNEPISENSDLFSSSLSLIEETSRDKSQSNNWLSSSISKIDSQQPTDLQTCQTVKETVENVVFFAKDLDWVIDSHHKLFPQRKLQKSNETLSNSKKVQLFHCLVCFTDFPDAKTTQNHISGEQHRNSMHQYGCHSIEVTVTLNYHCTVCDHETKTFLNIYEHIMSDKHINRHRSTVVCAEKEPREVKDNFFMIESEFWKSDPFSFNWADDYEIETLSYEKSQSSRNDTPDHSESNDWLSQNFPKLNSASRERRVVKKTSENLQFFDEDLNWMVGSSHELYKGKKSRSLCGKASVNMRQQLFYCLVCLDNFSDVESAMLHISCKEHAESMKQFGCNFIEVTQDSKYKCACCNRVKKKFAFMYMHLLSGLHMNRVCEINKETDEQFGMNLVSKTSNDLKSQDNDVDQSFSQHSESFTEKPITPNEDTTSLCEASTSLHESVSCIFVTKRNSKKSYCHICENTELPIATKNLDSHIESLRHVFSLKRHGCDKIETCKNGSYYCACCNCQFSDLQNVYLHVKDKKHMSSLVKVKQESKRVKKVTRTTSPENRYKATAKPLLSEFIVKKINDPGDTVDADFYEPIESSSLPKYSSNSKNYMDKCNSVSGQLDSSKQPRLNSMLTTMVDDLTRLSNQKGKTEKSKFSVENSSNWINQQAMRNQRISRERIRCKICKVMVQSPTDFHSHMAKHICEEILSMKNAKQVDESDTEKQNDSGELMDLENFETITESKDVESEQLSNQSSDTESCLSLNKVTESPKFDRWLSQFDDSSLSGSDIELEESLSEENARMTEWDREQYLMKMIKRSKLTKEIDLEEVLATLNFDDNYIFELDDKLSDLQRGLKMSLIIDDKTIYCLVCRVQVTNTIKDYYSHLWSLDHCNYLDVMENDATEFAEFPNQFSDLDLAHEYMEEISADKVRCYLCKKDIENEDELLRDHIYENKHESACALTRSNATKLFETMKSSLKCDWYSIERYSCFACSIKTKTEVGFSKHLNGRKHTRKMLEWPNFERKMLIDCCLSCAVLWYGYRSSHFYHANEVETHNWLLNDGFYLPRDLHKSVKTMLEQPENYADRTIRHLDGIRAEQNSKEVAVINDLQKIVRLTYPRAKAYTFGSRVTGLSSEDSDIDIFLDCRGIYDGKGTSDSMTLCFINNVHKCLSKNPECWDVHEVLTECRSPILRVYHRSTGLACDISFNNSLAVGKTKFIKRIVDVYPKFRKLVIILKMWMAHCDLAGSERIAHNTVYWLIIFYLQNETIMPSIATLISLKNKSKIQAGCEIGVSYDFECWEPDGDTSVKELLRRFFTFYANFDFRLNIVCPLLGEAIKKRDFIFPHKLPKEMNTYVKYVKKSKDVEMFRIDSPMCIQDPFELQHNISKAVKKYVLNRFRICCLKSLDFMASL